jgi:FAD/FMN-containing dehydrogenase
MSDDLKQLSQLLGERGFLQDEALKDHPACASLLPRALMRPSSTQQLSDAMKICHHAGQPVVPQGGRTGLVGGQVAQSNEIIVSLERMNSIEELDPVSRTMTVQAGVALQTIQQAAEDKELMFPLDLGARGTATIGGNIATNAGGNRVLRFGMAREMVLGLEAVLADGTIISSMHSVIKNNTGYDLKQLFIGSEGTLGIVTRAVLRLRPGARSRNTALVAVSQFENLIELLARADSALGGSMSSFEVMWNNFYNYVSDHGDRHRQPLPGDYPYYVIIEAMGADQQADDLRFGSAMEELFTSGLVDDAVLAKSHSERESIWEIRDDVDVLLALYPVFTFDISVPLRQMESYVTEIQSQFKQAWPEQRNFVFGHLGDGNIHVIVAMGSDSADARAEVEGIVYGALRGRGGVISAEHGIGLEKKAHLDISRTPEEIALMQTLKKALDPKNILNPGKVISI